MLKDAIKTKNKSIFLPDVTTDEMNNVVLSLKMELLAGMSLLKNGQDDW